MTNLQIYKKFLSDKLAQKGFLSQRFDTLQQEVSRSKQTLKDISEALDILNVTSILAQTECREVIEKLVTEALQFVFGQGYSFQIEYQISRNQPEAYFYVSHDGIKNSLKDEIGGGVLDVVSFALRIVCWAINLNRTEPEFFFDEPFKNVDGGRLAAVGEMIKSLANKLGLQIIMITHEDGLIEFSDTCHRVFQIDGVSFVEKVT